MTQERIEKALKRIPQDTAELITNPIDIYYLTGLELSSGSVVLSHEKSFLLVDGRYFEACQNKSPLLVYLAEEGALFKHIQNIKYLSLDADYSSHNTFLKWEQLVQKENIELQASRSLLKTLRKIKDPDEILKLKKAAFLGSEGFRFLLQLLKPGVTEIEMACELEYFWKKKGAQTVAFDPIIAFGSNSSMPHHRAGNTILKENDIALIDIGVKQNNYHSDMTRVIFFGDVDAELKKIYNLVDQAKNAALKILKPGVLIQDVDIASRKVLQEAGYEQYFTHSLGHGIGLEVHEFPLIKSASPYGNTCLDSGMVITIEPGIYLPGIGGVRLEDTVVITETGYENLTHV